MTLKWKNTRKLVLMLAVILGVSGIFMLSDPGPSPPFSSGTVKKMLSSTMPYEAYKDLVGPMRGREVTLDQAQASVPFKIRLPTNTGRGFVQIRLLLSTDEPKVVDEPTVTIIYTALKLSSNASLIDVLNQNGIMLTEAPNTTPFHNVSQRVSSQSVRAIIAAINGTYVGGNFMGYFTDKTQITNPDDYLEEVNINGYIGLAGGTACQGVSWDTETTHYDLGADINYPLQQLIQIAQSIPVN